jgi:ADP-heptose:LPS heptosyltransferase
VSSRFLTRVQLLARTAAHWLGNRGNRVRPAQTNRVLVVATLLSGDALFLAPLLAKLRQRYPAAEICVAVSRAVAPLFSGRPYGVEALAHDPRDSGTISALAARGRPDLALVVGDNRFCWVAAAVGARWIVAFSGDRPGYKNWLADELHPFPSSPMAWGDMAATLVDGEAPPAYAVGDWPGPAFLPCDAPTGRYAVLHVEASTPLKHWEDEKWLSLAEKLSERNIQPIWSAGPAGGLMLQRIDPARRFPALGHRLDLAQIWHLVAGAALLVCPDTSVMHIGRLTGTPTVALFGPSSASLFGPGEFWRRVPYRAVTIENFPCRDQHRLFGREIAWIQRCQRTPAECPAPRCLHAIGVEAVARAALELL